MGQKWFYNVCSVKKLHSAYYIYYKYISNWHVFFKQEHKVWALQEGKELV